jgi:hypothetical protein
MSGVRTGDLAGERIRELFNGPLRVGGTKLVAALLESEANQAEYYHTDQNHP